MSSIHIELAERIENEIADIENSVNRTLQAWQKARKVAIDQDMFLDSVALNLHSFYSGLERLFELISRQIDHYMPLSKTWHHDILRRMRDDLPAIRPAVISLKSFSRLDKFLRFRHLVRNVYATNLVPEKMEILVADLPLLWADLKKELLAFAGFLYKLENQT